MKSGESVSVSAAIGAVGGSLAVLIYGAKDHDILFALNGLVCLACQIYLVRVLGTAKVWFWWEKAVGLSFLLLLAALAATSGKPREGVYFGTMVLNGICIAMQAIEASAQGKVGAMHPGMALKTMISAGIWGAYCLDVGYTAPLWGFSGFAVFQLGMLGLYGFLKYLWPRRVSIR